MMSLFWEIGSAQVKRVGKGWWMGEYTCKPKKHEFGCRKAMVGIGRIIFVLSIGINGLRNQLSHLAGPTI